MGFTKPGNISKIEPVIQHTLETAWLAVQGLVSRNARHSRSGVRLQEVTDEFVLDRAQQELNELKESPQDIDELADTVCILMHYAIRQMVQDKD